MLRSSLTHNDYEKNLIQKLPQASVVMGSLLSVFFKLLLIDQFSRTHIFPFPSFLSWPFIIPICIWCYFQMSYRALSWVDKLSVVVDSWIRPCYGFQASNSTLACQVKHKMMLQQIHGQNFICANELPQKLGVAGSYLIPKQMATVLRTLLKNW